MRFPIPVLYLIVFLCTVECFAKSDRSVPFYGKWQKAKTQYRKGQYWNVLEHIGEIAHANVSIPFEDSLYYYWASSYSALSMDSASKLLFEEAIDTFTNSKLFPKYVTGLQKIAYKSDNWKEIEAYYNRYKNRYDSNEITAAYHFFLGEKAFKERNWADAQKHFDHVKEGTEYYTLKLLECIKLAYLKEDFATVDANVKAIKDEYDKAPEKNKEVLNAAYTLYAQIYFGLQGPNIECPKDKPCYFEESQHYFKLVEKDSLSNEEKQFGLIWSSFRYRNYSDVIDLGLDFDKKYPDSRFLPEVLNLVKYCYWNDKDYNTAKAFVDRLNSSLDKIKNREFPKEPQIDSNILIKIKDLENAIYTSNRTSVKFSTLRKEYERNLQQIDLYLHMKNEYELAVSYFEQNMDYLQRFRHYDYPRIDKSIFKETNNSSNNSPGEDPYGGLTREEWELMKTLEQLQ